MEHVFEDVNLPIIGKARSKNFSSSVLPTTREVLQRFVFYLKVDKTTQRDAIISVWRELVAIWSKLAPSETPGYICCQGRSQISSKIEKLWKKYKRIQLKNDQDARKTERTIKELQEFETELSCLFDIAKRDVMEHLNEENRAFLEDQRVPCSALREQEDDMSNFRGLNENTFILLQMPRRISSLPKVIAAADRHKVSRKALNDIYATLIRECSGIVDD